MNKVPNTFVEAGLAHIQSSCAVNTPAMDAFERSLDKFRSDPKFIVGDVTAIAVSPFGPLGLAKAGFAYMCADVTYSRITNASGAPVKVPGLSLVRGGAVTVLTFLNCDGVDHVVLTEQARIPIGEPAYREAPAGMEDGDQNFVGVASKEMEEEVGLKFNGSTDFKYLGVFIPSAGGCDERIKMLFTRVKCDKSVLTYLEGYLGGALDENEQITARILPLSVVRSQIRAGVLTDAKLGMSLFHYLESPELLGWACERHLVLGPDGKPHMVAT